MSENGQTPEKKTFGQKLGAAWRAFWRFMLRLFIAVVIIGGLGAAAYFGIPYLYRTYVQPLQDLQAEVTTLKQESADRAKQVNQRILTLQEDIQSLRAEQSSLANKIEAQQQAIQTLQNKTDELAKGQAALQSQIDALGKKLEEVTAEANDAQTAGEALRASWDEWKTNLEQMREQVYVMQVMETLLRARVLLGQHDLGAAQKELSQASAALQWLAENTDNPDAPYTTAREHVLLAQKALPQSPEVALQDVEAAWQLLNTLIPKPTPKAETTPSATPAETSQPPSTQTPTPTPTPTPKP